MSSATKNCVECGVERNEETFYSSVKTKFCRKCHYKRYKHNKQKASYKEAASKQGKLYRQKNWAKMLCLYAYKRDSEATITESDVLEKFDEQDGKCFWFGVELDPLAESRDPFKPSLDRLDVDGNYSPENVVLSSVAANMGRQRASTERWKNFLSKVNIDGQEKESGRRVYEKS